MTGFDLERFITAQAAVYEQALGELRAGRKRSHWMWFVFPQITGLGISETSKRYAIRSIQEASAYLRHPVLGERLVECTRAVLSLEDRSAFDIFGEPDCHKFRSSLTLYACVEGADPIFQSALEKYFEEEPDTRTLEILEVLSLNELGVNVTPSLSSELPFRVFARRNSKSGKPTCGDSLAVKYFEDEELLLLAVADGVSSSPCDWKAAETACEAVVKRFNTASGTIGERMLNAASKAHNAVRQIDGRCAGSKTSLTFVVWQTSSDEINVLNVGDSRVYLGPDNMLEQITSDDVQPVILKRDGEVVLQAGVPVFMRGVTRSLGQTEALDFSVYTHAFRDNHLLLLVSDGISKNDAFTAEIPKIFNHPETENGFTNLVLENSQKNNDDASLIAVWRTASDETAELRFAECLEQGTNFRDAGITPATAIDHLRTGLLAKMSDGRNDEVNALLDYADKCDLRFDRNFLGSLLSKVIQQNKDNALAQRLRELIRKT